MGEESDSDTVTAAVVYIMVCCPVLFIFQFVLFSFFSFRLIHSDCVRILLLFIASVFFVFSDVV